jgi:hypothetical protein
MAIVQAGKQFTKEDLQRTAGDLASMIRDHIQSGMDFKIQLESWPDPDLVILGLTQEQVNAIKGFYIGDLPGLQNLLAQSVWIKQLVGTGV